MPRRQSPGQHSLPLYFYYSRKMGIFQDLQLLSFAVQYTAQGGIYDGILSLLTHRRSVGVGTEKAENI